ncbi:MAG TPA: hypothetical protein VI488_14205 [Candidatus Angelobacter sp.]
MDPRTILRIYRVTAATTLTAIVFWKFFDITKHGDLGDISPFAQDPYDAVGSFAFQVALLVGALTYARALRLTESCSAPRARLIVRGNVIVLGSITATLLSDVTALVLHPLPRSHWAYVLWLALGLMSLLTLVCLVALIVVLRGVHMPPPPPPYLTPADGLDDLWTPIRIAIVKVRRILPRRFVKWVTDFNSDALFARFSWGHPRRHPWRFACFLSLLAGVAVYLSKLREGPGPSLGIALLVAAIFITAESVAAVLGFAILGAYLGLRPPIGHAAALAEEGLSRQG